VTPWRPRIPEVLFQPLPGIPVLDRWLVKALLCILGPLIRVEGPFRLSLPGPVIIAFTHSTIFETLFAVLVLFFHRQERVGFMVDWMYGHAPVLGTFIAKADPIYVWNKRARYAWLERLRRQPPGSAWEAALARLALGRSLALFPEGKAHSDPVRLRRGRRGLGHIALASGVRIIPVGIDFPLRLRKGRVPRFGRVIFRVGEAMTFPDDVRGYLDSGDGKRRAGFAESVTHDVMCELARLSGRTYPFKAPVRPC
jgi:1-acyl-sn-glycerol-3-phosphate acyltransferase